MLHGFFYCGKELPTKSWKKIDKLSRQNIILSILATSIKLQVVRQKTELKINEKIDSFH